MITLQRERPCTGVTAALVGFVQKLKHTGLSHEVRHHARRHLLDTAAVMIAGAGHEVAAKAQSVLARLRSGSRIPVPGRSSRADLLDAAFLGGTAAHGLELDDGFRQGSVHPGCVVVPAALAVAYAQRVSGAELLEAVVAGYEAVTAIGAACQPHLRQRGFRPTSIVGVFGSAAAAGTIVRLSSAEINNTVGLAASSAAGLFAFVNGGADVKRLHAGHAAREGLQAAILAQAGIQGPPDVLEASDGFMHAFLGAAVPIALPPLVPFGVTDCYVKPHPCCRHIQPAVEALIALLEEQNIAPGEGERIEVATYRIAAAHASTGGTILRVRMSFPYVMALALKHRAIRLEHFEENVRSAPWVEKIARKVSVSAPPEMDGLYPQLRPARVMVTTSRGSFTHQVDEALGSRILPLDDAGLQAKFLGLVSPVLGQERAQELAMRLWSVDDIKEVAPVIEMMTKPA
jgi:2-methylcitrate dehydratase PrpD